MTIRTDMKERANKQRARGTTLQVGDFATIIAKHLPQLGHQGVVVEVEFDGDEDGPIGLVFPYLDPRRPFDRGTITRFEDDELRKDAHISIENEAEKLFRGRYHSLSKLRVPFSPDRVCELKGCAEKCHARGLINVCGSVSQVDLCASHAEQMHGKEGETFNAKQNWLDAESGVVCR